MSHVIQFGMVGTCSDVMHQPYALTAATSCLLHSPRLIRL